MGLGAKFAKTFQSAYISGSKKNKVRLKTIVFKFLFEFVVVFVGVFSAFQLNTYKEHQNDLKTQVNFYRKLVFEFEMFNDHLQSEQKNLSQSLAFFELVEAGEKPDFELVQFYYYYHASTVNSLFLYENFSAIHPQTARAIISGKFLLVELEEKIKRLSTIQQRFLIPSIHQKVEIYDPDTGDLKAFMHWYRSQIQEIYNLNIQLQEILTEDAIPAMSKQAEELSLGI